MKQKGKLYTILAVIGVCLFFSALLPFPDNIGGMLCGSGSGLAAIGLCNLLMLRQEKKHPEQRRRNEIEVNDERNVTIRNRAKAVSGEVLQWAVMAFAWLSIGWGAPLWITLAAVGVFLAKSFLELYLMERYQKEM